MSPLCFFTTPPLQNQAEWNSRSCWYRLTTLMWDSGGRKIGGEGVQKSGGASNRGRCRPGRHWATGSSLNRKPLSPLVSTALRKSSSTINSPPLSRGSLKMRLPCSMSCLNA